MVFFDFSKITLIFLVFSGTPNRYQLQTLGVPKVLKQKGSTAWVDGQNLLGAVVGNFCMDLAIKLAKEHGVGWVVAKNSNHFGIAGYWSLQAAAQGLVVKIQFS